MWGHPDYIENNNNYNIWRKDRKGKQGRGVMVMIKSRLKVVNVEYEKGKANWLRLRQKLTD